VLRVFFDEKEEEKGEEIVKRKESIYQWIRDYISPFLPDEATKDLVSRVKKHSKRIRDREKKEGR